MLAVVLSVGLVVDDAIVMTENIYNRIEKGMTPMQAGIDGSKEILFAIISTSITLLCVFVPIVFMEGQTGRLFREFAFVIAGAVVISTFTALTFTPMLSTKILVRREKKNAFYAWSEPFFEGLNRYYSKSLDFILRNRWIALTTMLVALGVAAWMWSKTPSEMAPMASICSSGCSSDIAR